MVKTLFSSTGGAGSIPGRGATCLGAKKPKQKQKQYCNKISTDFKKMVHIKKY